MRKIKLFKVIRSRYNFSSESVKHSTVDTLDNLIDYHRYTLETGKSYEHEKGNKKIKNPNDIKSIKSLITNLNNAVNNSAANGYSTVSYTLGEVSMEETIEYISKNNIN